MTRPEFRLPAETGNLWADWRAVERAVAAATTDEQRAAVAMRVASLTARTHATLQPMFESMRRALEQIGRTFGETMRRMFPALAEAEDAARRGAELTESALERRRQPNTGPPRRQRPPRRIDAPGARAV